jgi:D-alanyl-D-alanine-carboxypeptidase/D-alanyl-D-alanine-endopeptidase
MLSVAVAFKIPAIESTVEFNMHGAVRSLRCLLLCAAFAAGIAGSPSVAAADDQLLKEAVEFTGVVTFVAHKVPALVIGAVRNGERAVFGFGKTSSAAGAGAPDGKTMFRIGSVTKVFAGEVLASAAVGGSVALADPLEKHLGWGVKVPGRDGKSVRLIDLVTHAGGFPREVPHEQGPANDPFVNITRQAFVDFLKKDELLFAPGTGALYSNMGFDLLAAALANATGKPYPELLAEQVTRPLGMSDTVFSPNEAQRARLMQGHDFGGEPLPDVPTGPMIVGSGGLYSSVDDVLTWLQWHLDRFSARDAEIRLVDHAVWLQRDALSPVYGFDESGRMDALGLAWIVMMPQGDRPLILQKAGGLQGIFCYAAFAPSRGVGAFIAINQFDFNAGLAQAAAVNELIATLAPR